MASTPPQLKLTLTQVKVVPNSFPLNNVLDDLGHFLSRFKATGKILKEVATTFLG